MRSVKHSKCLMGWDSLPKFFHITIARLKTIFSYCYCWTKSQLVNVHVQDGNGFINRQELAVVMGNLGESLTQEEIQVYLGTSLKLSTPTTPSTWKSDNSWGESHPGRDSGLFRNIFEIDNTINLWQESKLKNISPRKRFRFIRIIENVNTINLLNLKTCADIQPPKTLGESYLRGYLGYVWNCQLVPMTEPKRNKRWFNDSYKNLWVSRNPYFSYHQTFQ